LRFPAINISFALLLICSLPSCKETNEQLISKGVRLSKEKKYNESIAVFTEVILRNPKLQLPYYNRGFDYMALKKYKNALDDFNKVITLQKRGDFVFIPNPNSPFADEESRASVSYYDALYQRAQVKFYMDSIQSSYVDFKELIDNYYEVSNCYLWQGVLWIKDGKSEKACEYFDKARLYARNEDEVQEADKMTKSYCTTK